MQAIDQFWPWKIGFENLEIFFTHDPTTLNRQGNDVGTIPQWNILSQRVTEKIVEDYIDLMTTEDTFGKRIVTKISPVSKFYEAEEVHQNYYIINLKVIVLWYLQNR
jgi:peptide-methionine (S)-S-oxide reductase